MILTTNFRENSPKFYICNNKQDKQAAKLAIICDFLKANAYNPLLSDNSWNIFLIKNNITSNQEALANLDEATIAIMPAILRQEAKNLRPKLDKLAEEWDEIRDTLVWAKVLVELRKEDALVFRQSGSSTLVVDKVDASLNKLIGEGIFKVYGFPALWTSVNESAY